VAEEHPIQTLMHTAMENLKEMIDVNKVVGNAVETPDGHVIIPVSKVSFGFVAGGSEFEGYAEDLKKAGKDGFPFGGGSGGGVSLRPVAFLVVGPGEIRLLPIDRGAAIDRLIDAAPQLFQYVQEMLSKQESKEDRYL
jgi:sporulation protein YtfJ